MTNSYRSSLGDNYYCCSSRFTSNDNLLCHLTFCILPNPKAQLDPPNHKHYYYSMDTIPLKRHDQEPAAKATAPAHQASRTLSSGTLNRKKSQSLIWIIIIVVIGVALTGLIILRFSRASEQGTAPLTADQLKSYISTQLASQDQSTINQQLNVSQYAQFQFGAKLSPAPAYVSWYVDDVPVARASANPFNFVWDSSRYSNGAHTLTAVAYDSNGQPLGATQRKIVIGNSDSLLQKAQNIVTYPWYWLFQL